MADVNTPPPDEITTDALKAFGDQYVLDVWRKATSRRATDPEGAVTAARALLEAVCKRILHDAGITNLDESNFPKLYEATAKTLDIAPSEKTATKFSKLLKACEEIITTVSSLRNELGDAHGHAVAQATPTQHAELAVTLAGAMATFLL